MKYYIIFTHTIYNLGGGQLLTLRKAKFLQSKGYRVVVIYKIKRGPFLLEKDFEGITTLYVPEFCKCFNLISPKARQDIETKLHKLLHNLDKSNSLVESHDVDIAVWAEYYSQKWLIPHVIYLIAETDVYKCKFYPYSSFPLYKLKRNEFWGCNSEGLRLSFNDSSKQFNDNYINVPFDPCEIPEESKPYIAIPPKTANKESYIISTISRIDKPYVMPLLSQIEDYCRNNPSKEIVFMVVGDTVFEDVRRQFDAKVQEINSSSGNLKVVSTGFCVPGKDFFEKTDLFIGMGTAVINAISQGCISLTIDPFTNLTGGVFGMEMTNFAFSTKEYDVQSKIDEVLSYSDEIKERISHDVKRFFDDNYSMENTWKKQCSLQQKIPKDNHYFSLRKAFLYKPVDVLVYRLMLLYHFLFKS